MAVTTNPACTALPRGERCNAPLVGAFATAVLICTPALQAAEWKFTPSVDVTETYTDNLRLTTVGTEQTERITQISPGIGFAAKGRAVDVKGRLALQRFAYARNEDSGHTDRQVFLDGRFELLKDLLSLDAKSSVSRQTVSAFGPQPLSDANLVENRSEVRTTSVSPVLKHRFGTFASSEVRFARESVFASTGALPESHTNRATVRIDSGESFRTVGWGLQYDRQRATYSNATSTDMESVTSTVRYRMLPRLSLLTSAGYEKNSYLTLGSSPQGANWSAGLAWTPSPRTNLSFTAGHRFFGRTFSLMANERTRNSVWSLGYNQDITTTQAQFLVPASVDTASFLNQLWKSSIPDAAARQQAIETFIRDTGLPSTVSQPVNSFSSRVFLQKSLQGSVALNGVKNTLLLSLFDIQREAQSSASSIDPVSVATASLEDRTRQSGLTGLWTFRFGPHTSLNTNVAYSRTQSPATGRMDNNRTVRISLTRQFQPKLRGSLEVRRLNQTSNQTADVRENAVSAALSIAL
jgi:uncharacterized protein (PEP-CTERM system associated)